MEELEADRLEDPMARLVFSVHLPADEGGWSSTPAVTGPGPPPLLPASGRRTDAP